MSDQHQLASASLTWHVQSEKSSGRTEVRLQFTLTCQCGRCAESRSTFELPSHEEAADLIVGSMSAVRLAHSLQCGTAPSPDYFSGLFWN